MTAPHFARGFRFRHDAVRNQWVILGPERAFIPDETAVEILQLIDGTRTLPAIIDSLATRYNAPREIIENDVTTLMDDLRGRGVLKWEGQGSALDPLGAAPPDPQP